MKNTYSILVLFLFLIIAASSTAQNIRTYVQGNIGLSQIPSNDQWVDNEATFEQPWQFSWKYGMGVSCELSKGIIFETGIDFSIIRHQETNSSQLILSPLPGGGLGGLSAGVYTNTTSLRASSFSIPLQLKYKFKQFGISSGMQVLYMAKFSAKSQTSFTFPNSPPSENTLDYELAVKELDLGILTGLSYDLNEFLSINADFYYGIRNILKPVGSSGFPTDWTRKNRQFTFGLRLYI